MDEEKKESVRMKRVPDAIIEFLEKSANGEYTKIPTEYLKPARVLIQRLDYDEDCYFFGLS